MFKVKQFIKNTNDIKKIFYIYYISEHEIKTFEPITQNEMVQLENLLKHFPNINNKYWAKEFLKIDFLNFSPRMIKLALSATNYGNLCLDLAIQEGQIDCVQKLIDLGADVNAKDDFGFFVLYSAIMIQKNISNADKAENCLACLNMLLKNGVDLNKLSVYFTRNALEFATSLKLDKVVDLLKQEMANRNDYKEICHQFFLFKKLDDKKHFNALPKVIIKQIAREATKLNSQQMWSMERK